MLFDWRVFGRCCPNVRTVALLLHAISIIRTERSDSLDLRPDGWTSFAQLAISRIVSRRNNHIVQTVTTVFPYLCLERKSFYLLNTERRPDVLLRRSNGCNLEQIEASGYRWEFGWKVLVVRTYVAWLTGVWTEYYVFWADARDMNFTVLNSAQSLLEARTQSINSEYNSISD
jgi:hypothetical protein